MPAPLVTTLPIAPARLNKPDSFVNESVVFLDALPAFRTQVNNLNTHINSVIINKWNYGSVDVTPSFPDISQYAGDVIPTEVATVEYIASIDSFYENLSTYSSKLNAVGTWIDNLSAYIGTIPYDINKPLVSGISAPHTRDLARPLFNSKAEDFTETGINNINSMYQSCWYNYNIVYTADDYGLVTDTNLTVREDYGLVTDATITY